MLLPLPSPSASTRTAPTTSRASPGYRACRRCRSRDRDAPRLSAWGSEGRSTVAPASRTYRRHVTRSRCPPDRTAPLPRTTTWRQPSCSPRSSRTVATRRRDAPAGTRDGRGRPSSRPSHRRAVREQSRARSGPSDAADGESFSPATRLGATSRRSSQGFARSTEKARGRSCCHARKRAAAFVCGPAEPVDTSPATSTGNTDGRRVARLSRERSRGPSIVPPLPSGRREQCV